MIISIGCHWGQRGHRFARNDKALPVAQHAHEETELDHGGENVRELIEVQDDQIDGDEIEQHPDQAEQDAASILFQDEQSGADQQHAARESLQDHAQGEPADFIGRTDQIELDQARHRIARRSASRAMTRTGS